MTIMQKFCEGACNDTVIYCISEKALLCLAREIRPGLQRRMPEQRGNLVIIHLDIPSDHYWALSRACV